MPDFGRPSRKRRGEAFSKTAMCGIAGLISKRRSPADREAAVQRMRDAMPHRGPDEAGQVTRGDATIGLQRLAIFDRAHGQQPMQSPDGRYALVFNGAIYNFRELRPDLAAAGYPFRTDCDTEVLLAAWSTWGLAGLRRLRGMYAFAVWDNVEHSLVLARDPFGIKPLYWRAGDGELQFASELNALLAGRRFDPEIDPASVDAFLAYLAVPAPATIYRGVHSLRPAEHLVWRGEAAEVGFHWRFPGGEAATVSTDEGQFLRGLRQRLEETVAAHQVADVPVGAFLSGGLDSAAVVGLMAQRSSAPLKTFSIGFEEPEFSEAAEAAATARHFGASHQPVLLTARDAVHELDRFIQALDQPTGDALNTYFVARAARAGGVTVALSGLGGDELFGGYPSFRDVPRVARLLPWWRRCPGILRAPVQRRLGAGDARQRKLGDMLRHARSVHELAVLQRRVLSDEARRELLLRPAEPAPLHPALDRLPAELAGNHPQAIVSAWELRTYMADVLLRDSDIMSMAHSLELRVPLIDVPFVEWLWQQPARFRFTPNSPKSALAAALADLLPPDLPSRRKRGFTLPFARWMRGELRPFLEDTFSAGSVTRTGLLSPTAVQATWQRYLKNNDDREWSRVWSIAVLVAFLNRRPTA